MSAVSKHELLAVLQHCGADTPVKTLMDYLPAGEDRSVISNKLIRMRDRDWVTSELREGVNYWTLTASGIAEVQRMTAQPAIAQPAVAHPAVAHPAETPAEPQEPAVDPIAQELLLALEVETALDAVCAVLSTPAIPARTQRAYLRIESALPAVLREALAPLTAIVGGAS